MVSLSVVINAAVSNDGGPVEAQTPDEANKKEFERARVM
jgi:hypothetical protein